MQPAERWPLRRRLSIVVDRFRTSDFGLGERLDLADGQHVGDATLAFFGAISSLGPEPIDADTAALGQAELGHFGCAVSSQTLALKKIVASTSTQTAGWAR